MLTPATIIGLRRAYFAGIRLAHYGNTTRSVAYICCIVIRTVNKADAIPHIQVHPGPEVLGAAEVAGGVGSSCY